MLFPSSRPSPPFSNHYIKYCPLFLSKGRGLQMLFAAETDTKRKRGIMDCIPVTQKTRQKSLDVQRFLSGFFMNSPAAIATTGGRIYFLCRKSGILRVFSSTVLLISPGLLIPGIFFRGVVPALFGIMPRDGDTPPGVTIPAPLDVFPCREAEEI